MQLSISEMLFTLVSKKSSHSTLYHFQEDILESGLLDLLINHVIQIKNHKFIIKKKLPNQLAFLRDLLDYIDQHLEHQRRADALVFSLITNAKPFKMIYYDLGEKLVQAGLTSNGGTKGFILKHENYVPNENIKQEIIKNIKAELIDSTKLLELSIIGLTQIMLDYHQFLEYFSYDSIKAITNKMKKLRNQPKYYEIFQIITMVNQCVNSIQSTASRTTMASIMMLH